MIIHDDCLVAMAGMEPESVDAIVTDPPYGLEFMGKEWDKFKTYWAGGDNMKPKGSTMKRGDGPTLDRLSSSYGYRQKQPRCRNCGKLIGRGDGVCKCPDPRPDERREESGYQYQFWCEDWARAAYRVAKPSAYLLAFGGTRTVHRMTVALEDAGWIIRDMLVWGYASGFPKSKASLKPAWEPIVMARKPGPLRMLAIDECRIGTTVETWPVSRRQYDISGIQPGGGANGHTDQTGEAPAGRWPANLVLTDPIFDGGIEGVVGGGTVAGSQPIDRPDGFVRFNGTDYAGGEQYVTGGYTSPGYGDSGTYSRFFLIPKADRSDREPVRRMGRSAEEGGGVREATQRANHHPTVKPTDLMRHLVRLVTPTGGVVLDPFGGSGSTAIACELEGFPWILIEREAEYVAIAEARLNGTQRGLGLDVDAPTPQQSTSRSHWPKTRTPHKTEGWGFSGGQTDLPERTE